MSNNQSAVIFGALFVAYIVFISVRGERPMYAGFLLSTPTGGNTTLAGNTASGNTAAVVGAVGAAQNQSSAQAESFASSIITGAIAGL